MSRPHTEPVPAAEYTRIVNDLTYRYDGVFNRDTVQRAVDQARATLEPIAKIPNFLPILTERFARDQLLAAAQAKGKVATSTPEILFVCVHNAGRSQMAAALAKHLPGGKVHVRSAGSQPTQQIHPLVIQALAERGIALTQAFPKPLTDDVVPCRRRDRHHGLRGHLPRVPGQEIPQLGSRRPRRQTGRRGPTDH